MRTCHGWRSWILQRAPVRAGRRAASGLRGNRYLVFASRLIIGVTFLLSGVGKLPTRVVFVDVVVAHGLLPEALARAYGVVLPWLEIVVGVLLVAGLLARYAAGVGLLMVVSFLIANGTAVYSTVAWSIPSCGCFGFFEVKTGDALVIDLVMGALLGLVLLHRGEFLSVDGALEARRVKVR